MATLIQRSMTVEHTNHHMNVEYLNSMARQRQFDSLLWFKIASFLFLCHRSVLSNVRWVSLTLMLYIRKTDKSEKHIQFHIFSSRIILLSFHSLIVDFNIWFQFQLAMCTMYEVYRCMGLYDRMGQTICTYVCVWVWVYNFSTELNKTNEYFCICTLHSKWNPPVFVITTPPAYTVYYTHIWVRSRITPIHIIGTETHTFDKRKTCIRHIAKLPIVSLWINSSGCVRVNKFIWTKKRRATTTPNKKEKRIWE